MLQLVVYGSLLEQSCGWSSDSWDYRLAADMREDLKVQGKPSSHFTQNFTIISMNKSIVLRIPLARAATQWVYKLSGGANECLPVPEILLQLEICSFGKGTDHSSKSNILERDLLVQQRALTSGVGISVKNTCSNI